jgi:sugar phosphate isomerase/epimerase
MGSEGTLRLGVSSYSFATSLSSGRITPRELVDWVADSDADHLEFAGAGLGISLADSPELVADIAAHARERAVPIENYAVAADFRGTGDELAEEIERVKREIEVAAALGSPCFRHDVTAWAWRDADQDEFERTLAQIIPVCRELTAFGAERGVATTVENHGFFMNNSERLRRLAYAVGHPNFGVLLDLGNFLCVDENPLSAARQTLPWARVVHLKDFRVRSVESALGDPGEGWLTTLAGSSILGTVVGFGDLPIRKLLRLVADSGFAGPLSIEFEGVEDDLWAIERGIANARRMWAERDAEIGWTGVPSVAPSFELHEAAPGTAAPGATEGQSA